MSKNGYEIYWNLGNLLYQKKILKVSDFQALLREHGVSMSYAHAHQLVNAQPLRVTLRNILGICEALDCSIGDLLVIRKTATQKEQGDDRGKRETGTTPMKRIPKKLIGARLNFD